MSEDGKATVHSTDMPIQAFGEWWGLGSVVIFSLAVIVALEKSKEAQMK